MHIDERAFEKALRDSALVDADTLFELKEAARKKNVSLGDMAVSQGEISPDDLRRLYAYVLGLPFVDLKKRKIDFSTLSLIPEGIARTHNVVAYNRTDDNLEVVVLDPEDLESIAYLFRRAGLRLLPRMTDEASMKQVLLSYQHTLQSQYGDAIREEAAEVRAADGASASRTVDSLLKHAITQGASDIHIEPQEHELLIRYRVGPHLKDAMILPKAVSSAVAARLKQVAGLTPARRDVPEDGSFHVEVAGEKVACRLASLPTAYGEKMTLRVIRENARGFTLESLGYRGEALETLTRALHARGGLILVAGPAGAGKTTTLYTLLDLLNTPDANLVTIEDPIETSLPRVNQSQIRPDIGFTFARGLRAALRQDPDVVMVGELRDPEATHLALNAILGHRLVLAGLTTTTASGALHRLLDMKADPFAAASSVKVVVAQRLVRTLGEGKGKYFLTAAEIKALGKLIPLEATLDMLKKHKAVPAKANWKDIPFYRARGEATYAGQTALVEVLPVTAAIKELVLKGASPLLIEKQAAKEGMLTMLEDGLLKAVQGHIALEDMLKALS